MTLIMFPMSSWSFRDDLLDGLCGVFQYNDDGIPIDFHGLFSVTMVDCVDCEPDLAFGTVDGFSC